MSICVCAIKKLLPGKLFFTSSNNSFLKDFYFNYAYACLSLCGYVCVNAGVPARSVGTLRSLRIGSCAA